MWFFRLKKNKWDSAQIFFRRPSAPKRKFCGMTDLNNGQAKQDALTIPLKIIRFAEIRK